MGVGKSAKYLCCINISNSALWEMGTKDKKFYFFFLSVTKCKPTGCLTSSNGVPERIT